MSRPHKATRDQIIHDTREQLLNAAAAEFAGEGYVGANINRISNAAGFAKGTIYNYFPSKHVLLTSLIDEIAAEHVAAIVDSVQQAGTSTERLAAFFEAGFAFVERCPNQTRVIINAVYGPDVEFKDRVYTAYEPLFNLLIQDIIGVGIASDEFRPVDPNVTAAMVMTIYLGSCSQRSDDGSIWLKPETVMSFILDGLRISG